MSALKVVITGTICLAHCLELRTLSQGSSDSSQETPPQPQFWLTCANAASVLFIMAAYDTQAGALVAGVVFGLVSDRAKFVISAVCGAVGMAITMLFVPDISGLDLSEGGFCHDPQPVLTARVRFI